MVWFDNEKEEFDHIEIMQDMTEEEKQEYVQRHLSRERWKTCWTLVICIGIFMFVCGLCNFILLVAKS